MNIQVLLLLSVIIVINCFSNQNIDDSNVQFEMMKLTRNSSNFYSFNSTPQQEYIVSGLQSGFYGCGEQLSGSDFVGFKQQVHIKWGPLIGLIVFSLISGFLLHRYIFQSKNMPKHWTEVLFQVSKVLMLSAIVFSTILTFQAYFTPWFFQQRNISNCFTVPQVGFTGRFVDTRLHFFQDCKSSVVTDSITNKTYKIPQWGSTQVTTKLFVIVKVIPLLNMRCFPFQPSKLCQADSTCYQQYVQHSSSECIFGARSYTGVDYIIQQKQAIAKTYSASPGSVNIQQCDNNVLNCVNITTVPYDYINPATSTGVIYQFDNISRSAQDPRVSLTNYTLAQLNSLYFRGVSANGQPIIVQTIHPKFPMSQYCLRSLSTSITITPKKCTHLNITQTSQRYIIKSNETCQLNLWSRFIDTGVGISQTISTVPVSVPLQVTHYNGSALIPNQYGNDTVIDIDPLTGLTITQKYPDAHQNLFQWDMSLSTIVVVGFIMVIILAIVKFIAMRNYQYGKL